MNILGFNISRLQNVSGVPAPSQSAFTKIQKQSLDRIKQSVSDWRDAIEFAEDVYYPNNEELIRLYRELVLDPQVSALIETMLYQARMKEGIWVHPVVEQDTQARGVAGHASCVQRAYAPAGPAV